MKEISDEILNKLIDNELDFETKKNVLNEIKHSDELRKRFEALKLIHFELADLPEEKVSDSFTDKLMKRLPSASKEKASDKWFIFSISAIFILIAIGITGFILAQIISTPSVSENGNGIINEVANQGENIGKTIAKLFSSQNISIMGSIISFGVIISGYFFFDFHKRTNQKLQ